jgi:hypothetical protein
MEWTSREENGKQLSSYTEESACWLPESKVKGQDFIIDAEYYPESVTIEGGLNIASTINGDLDTKHNYRGLRPIRRFA